MTRYLPLALRSLEVLVIARYDMFCRQDNLDNVARLEHGYVIGDKAYLSILAFSEYGYLRLAAVMLRGLRPPGVLKFFFNALKLCLLCLEPNANVFLLL